MQPAVDLAKTFERRKCNHREPITGDECIFSVTGHRCHLFYQLLAHIVAGPQNKHRYVVATQSSPLRVRLRSIPAVPIVHINRSVMVLEPPSDVTMEKKSEVQS
jgi:U3 small nucleolar RNA-associated protein 23